ncbi:hypothetical protein B7486_00145 [cyanobacterium TDX16]|nr:hypothetical protein B7486_00145 [cyanobacterium TDX16]
MGRFGRHIKKDSAGIQDTFIAICDIWGLKSALRSEATVRRIQKATGMVIILGGCLTLAIIGTIQVIHGNGGEQDYSPYTFINSIEGGFWSIVATCTLAIVGGFVLTIFAGRKRS